MIGPALRWTVAATVTVAAFAVTAWICGALVLRMHDGGVRWVIASSLGVAVAALATLWGQSYATAGTSLPEASSPIAREQVRHRPVLSTSRQRLAYLGRGILGVFSGIALAAALLGVACSLAILLVLWRLRIRYGWSWQHPVVVVMLITALVAAIAPILLVAV